MINGTEAGERVQKDDRTRAYISPSRILWKSTEGVVDESALLVARKHYIMQRSPGAEPPGILLDFGAELHGGVRIDSPRNSWKKPVRFRVRFGESVSEAMGEPNNDHSIHDQEVLVPHMGYIEVGCTGFRFVRIDLLDAEVAVTLNMVKAVAIYRDIDYLGSFECSDKCLNEIWRVSARTVHLCLQDHLWDGIKRDRLVWIGDIHPETRVVSAVFGQLGVVERSLDFVRDNYPLPGWMNGISSYSIWWIIAHYDWYQYHGDIHYLCQQRDYLLGLLDLLPQFIDAQGSERLGGQRFLDWLTVDDSEAIAAGLQALLVLGLGMGSELCRVLGEEDAAEKAANLADLVASYKGVTSIRKPACALRVLAGLIDPRTANSSVLAVDPYRDMSTFYGYYVLEARAKAGDYLGCIQLIRKYWGAMLDLGATTFWEHFDLDWACGAGRIDEIVPPGMRDIHVDCGDHCYKGLRHSLCHGWAAGPTAWLSEHVLGIAPACPGFQSVKIDPNLGDLHWAHGTMPTPFGVIEVHHEARHDGTIHTDITLPDGVSMVDQVVHESVDHALSVCASSNDHI